MSKKLIVTMAVFILCVLVTFSGCQKASSQTQKEAGLKVGSWNSGLGSVNEKDLDKTKFTYSVNLTNENNKSVYIKSAQPIVNESIKNKIISKDIVVAVNKDLKPNETVQISGEIIVDTKGMTKSDITKLEPFITDMKVSIDETVSLK